MRTEPQVCMCRNIWTSAPEKRSSKEPGREPSASVVGRMRASMGFGRRRSMGFRVLGVV